jgi:hypothetical protein
MTRWSTLSLAALGMAVLATAPAIAQQAQPKPAADCKANTPAKVEGQVVSVDPAGKVTVRANDGKTHEFQATAETAKTMKPGDRLEATLREAPKC